MHYEKKCCRLNSERMPMIWNTFAMERGVCA
jgi:hypothetical protein